MNRMRNLCVVLSLASLAISGFTFAWNWRIEHRTDVAADFIYSPEPAWPPQEPAGISTHPEWTQRWWSDLTPGRTHIHMYFGCDPHCVFEDNSGRSMGECLEVLDTTSLKWPDRYCLRWMPRARR